MHIAVVTAELCQLAQLPQVGTAVPDPGQLEVVADNTCGHHGGAHRQAVVALARQGRDLGTGLADGRGQVGAAADMAHDRITGQAAGDLAAGLAAHPVSHQPQAQLGITVISVFVEGAAQAGVGEVAEFDHGGRWLGGVRGRAMTGAAAPVYKHLRAPKKKM